MANEASSLTQIHRQIMWNCLIAVVEEQARIMIRTASPPRCARPAICPPECLT